jgi:hypothetical protein
MFLPSTFLFFLVRYALCSGNLSRMGISVKLCIFKAFFSTFHFGDRLSRPFRIAYKMTASVNSLIVDRARTDCYITW